MKRQIIIALLCWTLFPLQAQTLSGSFPQCKDKEVRLTGYSGFAEKELAKTQCDNLGNFQLAYPVSYVGAASLQAEGSGGVILLLNQEDLSLQWDNMEDMNTLRITGSPENEAFERGNTINAEAEQKLSALRYLLSKYEEGSNQHTWLKEEIESQEKQFVGFVNQLPSGSYAASYLNIRKFVSDMFIASQQQDTTGLSQIVASFSALDLAADALWQSGLAVDMFTGIYKLMESYQDVRIISEKSNQLTTTWINALAEDQLKKQSVAEYCFKLLEGKGLTVSSEYLAISMLSESACQLDEKTTLLFDQYRKMAEGNTAPDIDLTLGKKLSKLNSQYKVVVFGASWCPDCQNDYPSLVGIYKQLKEKYDVDCVYVSLDTDKKAYQNFFKDAPFTTLCDTESWDSPTVKDYCVVATPTFYVLDKNLRILKKLTNAHQLEEFVTSI